MREQAVVITTIQAPTEAIITIGRQLGKTFLVIVIGDKKSPPLFSVEDVDYYDIEMQRSMDSTLAGILPYNHYARKNLGYLLAIKNGAKRILETDDDNKPYPHFGRGLSLDVDGEMITASGWYNVYKEFTQEQIWPRGFPLERIQQDVDSRRSRCVQVCPVQQFLANNSPDVDAVYRLTRPSKQIQFAERKPVILDQGTYCPLNSQNTLTFEDAFPLLYLPAYVSFRMTDIWRGLIAQAVLWSKGWYVGFHSPTVYQDRNVHNLLKDFEEEVPGYLQNQRIVETLNGISYSGSVGNRLYQAYEALHKAGIVPEREVDTVKGWLMDLERLERE